MAGRPQSARDTLAGAWGRTVAPERSIVRLIAERVLDAELAALLWLLVEARTPILVAAEARGTGRTTLMTALLAFLPGAARPRPIAGARETFSWLPEAAELGWHGARHTAPQPAPHGDLARPDADVLLVEDLSKLEVDSTSGQAARIVIRALSLGYGLAATMRADRLEDVFERLRSAPVHASDDELSRLGVVLVMRRVQPPGAGEPRPRVVAAHYVRPVVRDQHGHVQRMPPGVIAAYEPRRDELEHFAWGMLPELAARTGRRAGDFEREQARRSDFLAALAAAGVDEPEAVRMALARYVATADAPAS